MNIKFTITLASIINMIVGVFIILIGMQLLNVIPADSIGELCQQILGLICIGYGGNFKLIKGE